MTSTQLDAAEAAFRAAYLDPGLMRHALRKALDAADKARDAAVGNALECARCYGGIDGGHHKAWVIDQMVRALTGDKYAAFIANAKAGEDGAETYDWDEGITP